MATGAGAGFAGAAGSGFATGATVFGAAATGVEGCGSCRAPWRDGGRIAFTDGGDDLAQSDFTQSLHGLDDAQFEVQQLVAGPAHARIHLGEAVHHAQETFRLDHARLLARHRGDFGGEVLLRGRSVDLMHQHGAKMLDDVREQPAQVLAAVRLRMKFAKSAHGVPIEDAARQCGHGLPAREAEDVEHIALANGLAAEGHELIEHGLRIAHAALRALGDGIGGFFIQLHLLESRDVKQMLGDDARRECGAGRSAGSG